MLEIPSGTAGMGMQAARQLTRDQGTEEFSHHPAQYLFKDAGDRMSEAADPQAVVDMMDAYGVQIAQIGVNARDPEPTLELFDKFPGRFFGAVGVDPNTGMESVRALEETVKLHPNIKRATLHRAGHGQPRQRHRRRSACHHRVAISSPWTAPSTSARTR